jgi:hypothetical protein
MAEAIGPQRRAVNEALKNLTVADRDKAAVQLAKRYAALIDEATPASKYRDPMRAISRAIGMSGDEDAVKAFDKIADALAAHSVMSDLGPKLLAVLTALGMTPAGRGAKIADDGAQRPKGPTDELREQAEKRRRRANGEG